MPCEPYDHLRIEPKWQARWSQQKTHEPDLQKAKNPYYALMMFPYPSAEGLHVGNVYAFTGADIQGRFARLRGHDVFEPIGFDAFGIHSENYALKVNTHPHQLIPKNVDNFRRQLRMMGLMLDWSHECLTTAPDYYRWTQWIFLQLYKRGLAYRAKAPVNWCPKCHTVISNEQVIDGRCERHPDTDVESRHLEQWFFKTTAYAQRLLDNLEWIDWSEITKTAQKNWIGRSEGAQVEFALPGRQDALRVFTTRPDTLYGATYMVMAPEHPLVEELVSDEQRAEVEAYRERTAKIQAVERANAEREKSGVALGTQAINPVNGAAIPIWISDYVLIGYGTGAIMAVPAHDQRDYEFATKFGLPIIPVLKPETGEMPTGEAFIAEGTMINSGPYNGMRSEECIRRITADLEARGLGQGTVQYRLRDWCISRQRYWGPPIPMIYCDRCGVVPVPEEDLPVVLPEIDDFRPDTPGGKPLERYKPFHETTCPACRGAAHRDSDVSDNFLDSAWYFLRYPSAGDDTQAWDPEITRRWLPVDMYVGGNEHAVLHLMYTRFLCMAFKDMGLIEFEEPFKKFRAHGLLIKEGAKMSKSHGNVITPDGYVERYGADTLRMYLMFLGPYTDGGDFRDSGIVGIRRFLEKAHRFYADLLDGTGAGAGPVRGDALDKKTAIKLHQTIKKVGSDLEAFGYNTAIAALMELLTELRGTAMVTDFALEAFAIMLSPLAPHEAEEMWEMLGHADTIASAAWPAYDPALTIEDRIEIAIQVLGKLRGTVAIGRDATKEQVQAAAEADERIAKHLEGKQVVKIIHVPNRLMNFVVR
jgi:leucyl-tRNA synthetase